MHYAALLSVLMVAPAGLCGPQEQDRGPRIDVRVDPRVELLSIVFRLAGNPEYGRGKVDAYTRAVDAWFGKFRDHAVVEQGAALRRGRGVSNDAVMAMAVHLDPELEPIVPFAQATRLDRRWTADAADRFAAELRRFAVAADSAGFFAAQRELYELAAERMQRVLDEHADLSWFDEFFGARPSARFELALGMLNGGNCYGPSVALPDSGEQLYCVLGVWATDADGKPAFDASMLATVVHEFCHSYCNALVDKHAAALEPSASRIWPHVAAEMQQQAYADWKTMMCETLVRACVVRYQRHVGGDAAARAEIAEQHGRSFSWTGELAELLAEYEGRRGDYPSLDPFMPRVAEFFRGYAERFAAEMAQRPQVASISPAIGATDVDPKLDAIVITFDRTMRDRAWSVVGGGEHLPKLGTPSYDDARKVLTIPVELKPDWQYELWLNRGKYDSFQSSDGHKLRPVHVTFRTRG